MRPANNIDKLIKKLHLSTSAKLDERIHSEISRALEESERTKSVKDESKIWRIIMKSRITKLAAAAVIIIAVLIGVNEFGGSIDGASVAWAGLAERVEQIENYKYRITRSATSGPQKEGFEFIEHDRESVVYQSAQYGVRTDSYQDGQLQFSTFVLFPDESIVNILHLAKEYTRYPLPNAELVHIDPKEMVKQIMTNDYESLGQATINSVRVEGVELTGQKISGERLENAVTCLWVDVESGLPVRIELEGVAYGTTTKVNVVQDQFQWDVEFEASHFEPNIPPDYVFVEQELPSETGAQKSLPEEDITEPDLSDLEGLRLLGLEEDEPNAIVPLIGMKEIWRAQDVIMSEWPAYSEVYEQLYEELLAKLNLGSLPEEELITTAVALREKFWQAGGCLSKVSYPYGYAARLLLESAHNENPENMTITNELVEAIQTVELTWKYKQDSDERIRNIELRDILIELRISQFEQIKNELQQGRAPTWEDFVRVNDLAILLGIAGDYESALEAAQWLIYKSDQGGWTAYMSPLKNMQENFIKKEAFNFNISLATKGGFPEEFRYGRRLPSFKGPHSRGVTPIHLLKSSPVWHGH